LRNTAAALAAFVFTFGAARAGEAGKIAGRVLDEAGQPLPRASVVITGQALGAASDVNPGSCPMLA
jgi:hypothetical protein